MEIRKEFRKADSSDRLKRLMKERIYKYKNIIYEPGERVYVQDRISSRWDGPAIVKSHQGNEVNVMHKQSELSVSNMRIRPYDNKVVESEEEMKEAEENAETGQTSNTEEEENMELEEIPDAEEEEIRKYDLHQSMKQDP